MPPGEKKEISSMHGVLLVFLNSPGASCFVCPFARRISSIGQRRLKTTHCRSSEWQSSFLERALEKKEIAFSFFFFVSIIPHEPFLLLSYPRTVLRLLKKRRNGRVVLKRLNIYRFLSLSCQSVFSTENEHFWA